MEEHISTLNQIAKVKVGEIFSFICNGPMVKTSWGSTFYKRYYGENRYTMVEDLSNLIRKIERIDLSSCEQAKVEELAEAVTSAVSGLENLSSSYADDTETSLRIRDLSEELASYGRLALETLRGADRSTTNVTHHFTEGALENEGVLRPPDRTETREVPEEFTVEGLSVSSFSQSIVKGREETDDQQQDRSPQDRISLVPEDDSCPLVGHQNQETTSIGNDRLQKWTFEVETEKSPSMQEGDRFPSATEISTEPLSPLISGPDLRKKMGVRSHPNDIARKKVGERDIPTSIVTPDQGNCLKRCELRRRPRSSRTAIVTRERSKIPMWCVPPARKR